MALRRITRELKLMETQAPDCISAKACSPTDLMQWEGTIDGPIDSPYQGGKFKLKIQFPDDYPFNPPAIEFVTPVYHPNISEDGQICLDLLDSKWSPALTISKLLLSLQSLLTDPNIDDPLESQIAEQYRKDKERYDEIAREHTEKYAKE